MHAPRMMHITGRASRPAKRSGAARWGVTAWDGLALLLVGLLLAAGLRAVPATVVPIEGLQPIGLDPLLLPDYALRSTLRMFAALGVSLTFTFLVAPLAAKSRRAGMILIPMLDVLQSVPVLAFVSLSTVLAQTFAPGRLLGAELACVLTIATSQAWNMAFSLYQSLTTIPPELDEAARSFRLTGWQRFWRLEVATSIPGLVWNTMASLAGGWFFVVASEAIVVGQTSYQLPGLGSYVALALQERDTSAILWAALAMVVVVVACDQLLFRPLVAWSGRFRNETVQIGREEDPWMLRLLRRSPVLRWPMEQAARAAGWASWLPIGHPSGRAATRRGGTKRSGMVLWYASLGLLAAWGMFNLLRDLLAELTWAEILNVAQLGGITLLRVVVTLVLSTLIWVPLGVLIGLRPRLARLVRPCVQILASFPANLVFPVFVGLIVRNELNPDIWLTPLMMLGAQWYVLFNVLAGTQALPSDLLEAARSFHLRGLAWWRRMILPGILPYYVTGAIAASGGAWNTSIVAELAQWGDTRVAAQGIGSYIADATAAGDGVRLLLGVFILSRYVVVVNALVWQPLSRRAQRRAA